jgi:DNA-directed RNA polymerase sigma subunit (sigma70/sigma32)
MTPHSSRKRSLSSLPSPGLTSSKSWIAAAAVILGTLLAEMDTLSVYAFAPVHSSVSSSPFLDGVATSISSICCHQGMRTESFPSQHRPCRRSSSLSSTLFDEGTSTNNEIPSIELLTASILKEERKMKPHVPSLPSRSARAAAAGSARRQDNRRSQQLNVVNDKTISITSPINNVKERSSGSKARRRNRVIRTSTRSISRGGSTTSKKRILKAVRTIESDEMRLDGNHKKSQPLLSREEEQQLTHKVRSLRRAVRIRDSLVEEKEEWSSYHPSAFEDDFPTEQQWAQACGLSVMDLRRVMAEGQESRSILVSANVGLVTSIAKRHYFALKHASEAGGGVGTILTLQDMIQEGNLGLMKAAERFDSDRGFRFSTYATYWIRQRILQSISDSSRVIRLPAYGKLSDNFSFVTLRNLVTQLCFFSVHSSCATAKNQQSAKGVHPRNW